MDYLDKKEVDKIKLCNRVEKIFTNPIHITSVNVEEYLKIIFDKYFCSNMVVYIPSWVASKIVFGCNSEFARAIAENGISFKFYCADINIYDDPGGLSDIIVIANNKYYSMQVEYCAEP